MKLIFDESNYATPESILCKDWENHMGTIYSKRRNDDHEYGAHFELQYDSINSNICLYCSPDYEEMRLIDCKFCPWCGEKIEFELV